MLERKTTAEALQDWREVSAKPRVIPDEVNFFAYLVAEAAKDGGTTLEALVTDTRELEVLRSNIAEREESEGEYVRQLDEQLADQLLNDGDSPHDDPNYSPYDNLRWLQGLPDWP